MPLKIKSISTKTILPIICVFGAGIFALIFFIPQINKQGALETAISNAKSTIDQYKTLRSYYTENVVRKISENSGNLQATADHKIRKNAIPLPATVIHDLSALLANSKGIQLRLYSSFPFPNRKDRVLDDFAREALLFFETNPGGTFVKTDLTKGNELARVAIADKMVASSCVACHNTHPQTPKKGWKLGDVRGVLEVIVPINYQMKASREVSFTILSIIGLMFVIIVVSISLLFRWSISRPFKRFFDTALMVAGGNLNAKVEIKSKDEIGRLADSFNKMTDDLQKTTVSKNYMRNIFESMTDTLIVVNPDLTINTVNSAVINLLGYSEAELIGKPVSMVFEEGELIGSDINDAIKKGFINEEDEKIYITKDGNRIPVLFSSSVMNNDKGDVKWIICVAQDISKHKLMEEKLVKSEKRFSGILDIAEDAIVSIDETHNIIIYNKGAEHIFGYSAKEAINQPLDMLIPGRFHNSHRGDISKFRDSNIPAKRMGDRQYEIVGRRKNGEEFPAEASISQLEEAGKKIFTAVLRDITERKRTEERLLKLTTAVEQSPAIVVITDVNGKIEYANPKFTKLTGYDLREINGKNPRILKSGIQSREVYKRLWNTILSGNEWRGELHNMKKNGELYWEAVSISPIRNAKNVVTHFIKVAEDITRRKLAEDEVIKYEKHLEDLVEERSNELKTTYDKLVHSEKLSAVGNLSASIAHEFNNPIFGIKNVLKIVKDKKVIDEESETFLGMADRECDRMSDLIDKLRDFHRPSSGKKELFDVHLAINDTLLLSGKKLQNRHIKLEKDFCDNLPLIEVVPDQIKQVILNLINNAEHAILKEEGGKIRITTETNNDCVKINIQDNGCGINSRDIKSIFEPFYSTKGIKGTGLGLSISYGIIKEHGGEITVNSREGAGTIFTITLPVNAQNENSKTPRNS